MARIVPAISLVSLIVLAGCTPEVQRLSPAKERTADEAGAQNSQEHQAGSESQPNIVDGKTTQPVGSTKGQSVSTRTTADAGESTNTLETIVDMPTPERKSMRGLLH
ncbi:MAG: hypothetical protein ACI9MC_004194, partial [Kiritimatiellia bacterium]